MAKVYEALRRAEEERKRKVSGEATPLATLDWDSSPQTAPRRRERFWSSWFNRGARSEVEDAAQVNKRRISILQPDSHIAEQFRMLRGRIDSLASQRPIRTVAMTSPNAEEGKSTASINLAVVTSMGVGRQVLLMDCDLRRPTIHRSLGLAPKAGLAEVLLEEATFDEAVLNVDGMSLDVLAVHGQPGNPSELLASDQMRSLLEDVGQRYDRVILDTPATLGLPDSRVVSALCDGLVLVVRAGRTPRDDILATLEVLDRKRVLGLVLNDLERGRARYSYY